MKKTSIGDKLSALALLLALSGALITIGGLVEKQKSMADKIDKLDDRIIAVETESFMAFGQSDENQSALARRIDKIEKLKHEIELTAR